MTVLTVGFGLFYLTEVDGAPWRSPMDYNARIIVKGMKREDFKGYADFKIGGVDRRFDNENIQELMPVFMGYLAKASKQLLKGQFALVPIPSSNMAVGKRGPFRTVELAEMFAKAYGADAKVEPLLAWDAPRTKRHEIAGFRHPDQFEPHLRLLGKPTRPVVLFDDVLTSGSQVIASARFLSKQGYLPRYGLVAARATKTQHDRMLAWSSEKFPLDPTPFEIDF
jgi:hypothetical protein